MADIFDKVTKFHHKTPIVEGNDRKAAMKVLYRQSPIDNAGPWIDQDGRRILQFSTNDYLGLARHPRLRKAAEEMVSKYGVSAPMGARPLTGSTEIHDELERQFADFKRTERSLVFCNGAQAMMGCVAALAGPRDFVVLDRYAHASLVCGVRISGAHSAFFKHNDVEDLDAILQKNPHRPKMVIVDGVYSMQGDMAPLPEICELCEKHGARLLVDDAHGNGVCGKNGRGTAELMGVEDRIDLHLGTCSKAMATMGGFAAGAADVIEYLRFNAPTMLFTKAMPACIAAATLESLALVREGHDLRAKVWDNARTLQKMLTAAGFHIGNTESPITPIHGNGTSAVHMSGALYNDFGIWVSAVLYPAVPIGTSILRAIPTAAHSKEDLQLLVNALCEMKELSHAGPGNGQAEGLAAVPPGI
jgi:8-amino-7-oxononanoate synthase